MQLFFSYQWSADCCKPLVASRVLKKLILQFLPVSHCFYGRRNFLGSSASSLSSLANLNLKSFCCGNFLFSQFLRLCPLLILLLFFRKHLWLCGLYFFYFVVPQMLFLFFSFFNPCVLKELSVCLCQPHSPPKLLVTPKCLSSSPSYLLCCKIMCVLVEGTVLATYHHEQNSH